MTIRHRRRLLVFSSTVSKTTRRTIPLAPEATYRPSSGNGGDGDEDEGDHCSALSLHLFGGSRRTIGDTPEDSGDIRPGLRRDGGTSQDVQQAARILGIDVGKVVAHRRIRPRDKPLRVVYEPRHLHRRSEQTHKDCSPPQPDELATTLEYSLWTALRN